MKAWKKVFSLILALTLALSLASCSTIQSAIGSVTGQEDPSVAGNMPAGDHSGEEEWTPPSSSTGTPAPTERELDEWAEPIELYGVTVQKYKNSDYTVVDLGGGIHSDIHEITILDENGNELMPFPSGRPFREVARSFMDDERMAGYESPMSYPAGSTRLILVNPDMDDPRVGFHNLPGSEVSLLDLEFDSIESLWGDGVKIMAESLGKPTAAYVGWNSSRASTICYVWVCNGFYAEAHILMSNGDYTADSMDLYLDSLDKDELSNYLRRVLPELGLK